MAAAQVMPALKRATAARLALRDATVADTDASRTWKNLKVKLVGTGAWKELGGNDNEREHNMQTTYAKQYAAKNSAEQRLEEARCEYDIAKMEYDAALQLTPLGASNVSAN